MPPGERKPVSIRDVALASGVSLTTVSLVLNRADRRISQATRERVLSAIEQLGYRPNRLAQGLQSRRSRILAILVPQLNHTFADAYFGELISGIYDHASRSNYKILLEAAAPAFIRTRKYIELFDQCYVDGMLFMGSHDGHDFVQELTGPERPFLLVNNIMPGLGHVVCDYGAAGRLAAAHLLGLGHRRIGMIEGGTTVQTARDLGSAFAKALQDQGVALPPELVEDGLFTEEGGAQAAERLIRKEPALTAIFAGNDKMAIGAIHRLTAMGWSVPGSVSVMGCDNIGQAAFVTPPLTTVQMPLYDLGRRSCQRLLEMIRTPGMSCAEVLPVEVVIRGSTAKAAALRFPDRSPETEPRRSAAQGLS
ncbi:MAG: LacI family transcriptional regulator [Phycisphaerae bacterium]